MCKHRRRPGGTRRCPTDTWNDTAPDASAGFAPRSWARTTASCPRRAWCSASRPRRRRTRTSWWRGSPGWSPAPCRWRAGEYVSVHSQADTEKAEIERERAELKDDPKGERQELAAIYMSRGLDPSLARQVADQLTAHDALGAHARDELGITEALRARPVQAALASAASFAAGAILPLAVTAAVAAASPDSGRRGDLARVSRASRRGGGARRRRERAQGRDPRHVLERARHGGDRGRREALRNGGLSRPGTGSPGIAAAAFTARRIRGERPVSGTPDPRAGSVRSVSFAAQSRLLYPAANAFLTVSSASAFFPRAP